MVSTTYVAPKIFGTGFHILTDNCDKRSYCLEKLFMKYTHFVEDTLVSLGSLKKIIFDVAAVYNEINIAVWYVFCADFQTHSDVDQYHELWY